jgi:hypothetical protein
MLSLTNCFSCSILPIQHRWSSPIWL